MNQTSPKGIKFHPNPQQSHPPLGINLLNVPGLRPHPQHAICPLRVTYPPINVDDYRMCIFMDFQLLKCTQLLKILSNMYPRTHLHLINLLDHTDSTILSEFSFSPNGIKELLRVLRKNSQARAYKIQPQT